MVITSPVSHTYHVGSPVGGTSPIFRHSLGYVGQIKYTFAFGAGRELMSRVCRIQRSSKTSFNISSWSTTVCQQWTLMARATQTFQ
jgi:hypothetical protein